MKTYNGEMIQAAIRLFESRAISRVEADQLFEQLPTRDDFLVELWTRRGLSKRNPELSRVLEYTRSNENLNKSPEKAFYERECRRLDPNKPMALYVPRWRGVANSTRSLFTQTMPIPYEASLHPDDIDDARLATYVEILLATGCRHFIISGGDKFQRKLVAAVQRNDARIRFDLLWHSAYIPMSSEGDWELLSGWLHAAEHGDITRIGVVKEGLDVFLKKLGIDSIFIPNFVPVDNDRFRPPTDDNVVGIWLSSSWAKLPHAMIAAVKAMPSFYLKGAGLGVSGLALISALDVPFLQISENPVPYQRLVREILSTVVSLYVTASECSPMLPLESFSLGVPCLIGPSSHLFRDHAMLRKMLVVEQPYNAALIADMALEAAAQRSDLLVAYAQYAKEEEVRSRCALASFLA